MNSVRNQAIENGSTWKRLKAQTVVTAFGLALVASAMVGLSARTSSTEPVSVGQAPRVARPVTWSPSSAEFALFIVGSQLEADSHAVRTNAELDPASNYHFTYLVVTSADDEERAALLAKSIAPELTAVGTKFGVVDLRP